MMLPESFRFSQGSLQDYVDCPRRFQLRHLLVQPWPALITRDPGEFEQHLQRGARFHRLAHQCTLGVDEAQLAQSVDDPIVAMWWQTYVAKPPRELPESIRQAEVVLSAPLGGYRLLAKFDLLAADPGQRLVVVDWKTVLKRPGRRALMERLQTKVYRFLAVAAGASYYGNSEPLPEEVEMVYWFAEFGGATERFPYDAQQHRVGVEYLESLIREISAVQASIWPLTGEPHHCTRCNYRSLCEREVSPASVGTLDADFDDALPGLELELDLDQVAEITF